MTGFDSKRQAALDKLVELTDEMGLYDKPAQEPDDLTIAYMSGLYDGKKKRPWVGLTDEEIKQALTSVDPETKRLPPGMKAFARAIEAALRSKNT